MDSEIRWLLEQWARWRYVHHGGIKGYPNQTPFQRLNGSTLPSPQIDDPTACYVDLAVSQVCKESPLIGKALTRYFLFGLSYYKLAEQLGCYRKTAARRVDLGVARVGEILGAG